MKIPHPVNHVLVPAGFSENWRVHHTRADREDGTRKSPEDIPALIAATMTEFNEKHTTALTLHPELVAQVQALPFPGNIRELKNVVWQIASESGQTTGEITSQMLPPELIATLRSPTAVSGAQSSGSSLAASSPRDAASATEEAHQWRTFCE